MAHFTRITLTREFVFWLVVFSFYFQQFWIVSSPVPIKLYMIAVVIGALFLLLSRGGRVKTAVPLFFPFVVTFFLYIVASFYWSVNVELAFVRSLGVVFLMLTYAVLFFLAPINSSYYLNRQKLRVLSFFLFMTLLYYFVGLYEVFYKGYELGLGYDQAVFGLYMEGVLPRLRGFADSPNNFGLMLLPIIYYAVVFRVKLGAANITLLVVLLLMTISITNYIAIALPLLLLATFNKGRFLQVLIFLLIVIAVFLLLYNSFGSIQTIIDRRFDRLLTGSGRYDLFEFSIDKVGDSPIWGFGIAQARVYLSGFQGRELQSTHNSFIESFFEGGIIALTLFILCWASLLLYIVILRISSDDKLRLFCYLFSLFIFSSANLMIYLELMVLNFLFLWFFSVCLRYNRPWCAP